MESQSMGTWVQVRPSGGAIYSGNFFIKNHKWAPHEASLLLRAVDVLQNVRNVYVPVPVFVTVDALVLPFVEPAVGPELNESQVLDKALKLVRLSHELHSKPETLPSRLCTEEQYKQYVLFPEKPDWMDKMSPEGLAKIDLKTLASLKGHFREVISELGPKLAAYPAESRGRFVHGDFTFSNCFAMAKHADNPDHVGCLIDLSVKASPGFPEVDLSKILFSCLGFDVPYYPQVVEGLVRRNGLMQEAYGDPINWEAMAYFLASHALRVVRREPVSVPFLLRVKWFVDKMIRISKD